jgi:sortase A
VETARGDEMRLRNLILILAALTVVVALAACSSAGQSSGDQGKDQAGKKASEEQAQKKEPPKKMTDEAKSKQVAPKEGAEGGPGNGGNELKPPKNKMLKLTVPKMKEIKDDKIPTGIGTNEALFHDYAGVHLKRTGFPWQKTANVYIAGHRIGFPGTNSNLAFYDLEDLKKGDMVYVKDADGRQYTYKVFKKLVVEPTDLSVLKPIKGKNILSLQTCTLPDYTDRVIYQAELKDVKS